MRNILLYLVLCLFSGQLLAQYPNSANKIRLGNQTTGDGLIHRTTGIPAWTPNSINNAWLAVDTLTGNLYSYQGGTWNLEVAGDLRTVYPQVINKSGADIKRGQAVMVDYNQLVQGDLIRILPADGTGAFSTKLTMGIASTDIANNAEGYITWFGYVREVKESDIMQTGITADVGDILYLSPTQAGRLTDIEPTAPANKVTMALVVRKPTANNITLLVRPSLNEDLGELNDVDLAGLADGQTIVWDSINGKWIAGNVGSVIDTTVIATRAYVNSKVDSTRLVADSILVYYIAGVEVGRDTINIPPAGVTSITAGVGLTGGTITSTGTIAADTSVLATQTYVSTRGYLTTEVDGSVTNEGRLSTTLQVAPNWVDINTNTSGSNPIIVNGSASTGSLVSGTTDTNGGVIALSNDTTVLSTKWFVGSKVDSTRLVQDSILVYYIGGVELRRDTISGVGGGGGISGSGTAGQVTYWSGASAVTGSANFTWTEANRTLGLNTTTTSGSNIIVKNTQQPTLTTVVATQTFAADTVNWTAGTGWTFNGTVAVATAATGDLTYTPAVTITSGNAYQITYTIAAYSAGTITMRVGNANVALPTYNVTNNVVVLLPTSATGGIRFTTSTFTGNIDNFTVVEVSTSAPVVFAGQASAAATLHSPLRMPNATTIAQGGGGAYATGLANNFSGLNTGLRNTTGANNNFFGNNAGANNSSGSSNNFFGGNAGLNNTTGINNNFFGPNAGQLNLTGNQNNFFGNSAGANNRNGFNNNFFGNTAGESNVNGAYNNYFGERAGQFSTSGSNNNFFGNAAGRFNTTGGSNNFFGIQAGEESTTGSNNNFFGDRAGQRNRSGSFNNFIGPLAGAGSGTADTLTGSNNTIVGSTSGRNITAAASGNLVLGNNINLPTGNGSNQVVIKNVIFGTGASGTGTSVATGARVGINQPAPAVIFDIAGTDAMRIPVGTTVQRVGTPAVGMARYNSTTTQYEAYKTAWRRIVTLPDSLPAANTMLFYNSGTSDYSILRVGSGLAIAGDSISASGTATNLTFSGTSSPITLNSDTGTDVRFIAGSGVTLSRGGDSMTIAATAPTRQLANLYVQGAETVVGQFDIERIDLDNGFSLQTAYQTSEFVADSCGITYIGTDTAYVEVTAVGTLVSTANANINFGFIELVNNQFIEATKSSGRLLTSTSLTISTIPAFLQLAPNERLELAVENTSTGTPTITTIKASLTFKKL